MLYDVIIVGGGPAAVAAAVYVARKQLKSLLLTESFGGQSIVSDDIQNWIGEPHLPGVELAQKLEAHARAYPEVLEVKDGEKVTAVRAVACSADRTCDFDVATERGATYQAKSVIVAAGARRRKLGVPGEAEFNGKGVAYCSTCDAPLFKDKAVAVVGGGNAGLEAVQDLFPYASKVYLLVFDSVVRGDAVTFDKIKANPKLEVILNAATTSVQGETLVTGLTYTDRTTNEQKTLAVQGVFVEIGSVPNSEMVKDLVHLDKFGQVIIDAKYATTSHPGVFAAGDVTDDPFKQNNISAGDGVRAALSAYDYLLKRTKSSPAAEAAT
jgi:alkyl hydroperoxide reductase subunit F